MQIQEVIKAYPSTDHILVKEPRSIIQNVSSDSRYIEKDSLFIALPGQNYDGHDYILDALKKGACHFVINQSKREMVLNQLIQSGKPSHLFVVDDTYKAYQSLARYYLKKFDGIPRIAVTGSNGKTTSKELLKSLIQTQFKVLANEGNINNLVGVPQTAFQLDSSYEVAIFEFGTGKPGDIDCLSSIVNPHYGLITNIGKAHIEFFGTLEAIAKEKSDLFQHLQAGGHAFINIDSPHSDILIKKADGYERHLFHQAGFEGANRIPYELEIIENRKDRGYRLSVNGVEFCFSLGGVYNLQNLSGALAVTSSLGIDLTKALQSVDDIKLPGMRSEISYGIIDTLLDCYNANPDSMIKGLEYFEDLYSKGKKIAILADMKELGENSALYHQEVGKYIDSTLQTMDWVITIGKDSKNITDWLGQSGKIQIQHFNDKDTCFLFLQQIIKPGDFIFLKGSRAMKLEDMAVQLNLLFE